MELNRNHYLVLGVILLLLGIQFRFVETYHLTDETSQFLSERMERRNGLISGSSSSLSGLLVGFVTFVLSNGRTRRAGRVGH